MRIAKSQKLQVSTVKCDACSEFNKSTLEECLALLIVHQMAPADILKYLCIRERTV